MNSWVSCQIYVWKLTHTYHIEKAVVKCRFILSIIGCKHDPMSLVHGREYLDVPRSHRGDYKQLTSCGVTRITRLFREERLTDDDFDDNDFKP